MRTNQENRKRERTKMSRTNLGLMIGALVCLASMTGCREKTAAAEQAPVSVKVRAVEMNSVAAGGELHVEHSRDRHLFGPRWGRVAEEARKG